VSAAVYTRGVLRGGMRLTAACAVADPAWECVLECHIRGMLWKPVNCLISGG
jgi:hypothetical protein